MIDIKIKKLCPEAHLPEQAHNTDVGWDVRAISCEYDVEHDTYIYHTGLAIETNTPNVINVTACYGFPRSSNCNKEAYLTNGVGLIDPDGYRGEIQARFKNRTALSVMIQIETLKRCMQALMTNIRYDFDVVYNVVQREYIERAKALEFAPYEVGDKVFQLVAATEERIQFTEVSELNMNTDRGTSGYGGSGK